MSKLLRRLRSGRERGSSIVDFVFLGALFLIPMLYLVLGVFEVQRGYFGVVAASREASRTFVLANSAAEGQARAQQAATLAMEDQSINTSNASIDGPHCTDANGAYRPCFTSGSYARYTVTYSVPLPGISALFNSPEHASVTVSNTHISPYGDYRQTR